jgi:hypothetical protein
LGRDLGVLLGNSEEISVIASAIGDNTQMGACSRMRRCRDEGDKAIFVDSRWSEIFAGFVCNNGKSVMDLAVQGISNSVSGTFVLILKLFNDINGDVISISLSYDSTDNATELNLKIPFNEAISF